MTTWYLAVPGTWGEIAPWVCDPLSPFRQMMESEDCHPILDPSGRAYPVWTTELTGVLPLVHEGAWADGALAVTAILSARPYEERNVIAHSHGGQCALLAAAGGLALRTLTTVSTPHRHDMPAAAAAARIGYWQHLYDPDHDWIASLSHEERARYGLGQIGDGALDTERRFLIPGVQNVGIVGMRHSKILNDLAYLSQWSSAGLLEAIRTAPRRA